MKLWVCFQRKGKASLGSSLWLQRCDLCANFASDTLRFALSLWPCLCKGAKRSVASRCELRDQHLLHLLSLLHLRLSMLPLQEQSLGQQLGAGLVTLDCKSETFTSHQGPQHPHCCPSRALAEEQPQKCSELKCIC